MKKVYDFLEESEEGKGLISIIKGELSEVSDTGKKLRDAKRDLEDLQKVVDASKELIDMAKAEGITADSLKTMVENSRKGESDTDVLRREIKQLQDARAEDKRIAKEADERANKLTQETNNTKLKNTFAEAIGNINDRIKNADIDLAISKGDIKFDENGEATGLYKGEWLDKKTFSEKYRADNQDFIQGPNGAGSTPPKGGDRSRGTDENIADVPISELLARKYQN
jgi:hypothetical protein